MRELLAVYIDGETKTGKGSASQRIAKTLGESGLKVYYGVAGDFYRRYVAMVRQELGLSEADDLPGGEVLEKVAQSMYETGRAFEKDNNLGDLQRPSISNSVSVLGELPIAQKAGSEWGARTAKQAREEAADVLVVDGRNPRARLGSRDLDGKVLLRATLDLFMTCAPAEAARRTLLVNGVRNPTDAQIRDEEVRVIKRRDLDRHRTENPMLLPELSEQFIPGETPAADIVKRSWVKRADAELPVAIILDNTTITQPEMLSAVSELAIAAVQFRGDLQT